jgi:hypothetical protein
MSVTYAVMALIFDPFTSVFFLSFFFSHLLMWKYSLSPREEFNKNKFENNVREK